MKKIIAASIINLAIGMLFTVGIAYASGAFMSDEEYMDAHPEVYSPDGNWRSDWAVYLKNPEVYSGQCLHE